MNNEQKPFSSEEEYLQAGNYTVAKGTTETFSKDGAEQLPKLWGFRGAPHPGLISWRSIRQKWGHGEKGACSPRHRKQYLQLLEMGQSYGKTYELNLINCHESFWWLCKRGQVFHHSGKWKWSKTMNTCISCAAIARVFCPPCDLRWWTQANSARLALCGGLIPLLMFFPVWLSHLMERSLHPTPDHLTLRWVQPCLELNISFLLCLCPSPLCAGVNSFISKWGTLVQKQLSYREQAY